MYINIVKVMIKITPCFIKVGFLFKEIVFIKLGQGHTKTLETGIFIEIYWIVWPQATESRSH